jgi:hypothetical protein
MRCGANSTPWRLRFLGLRRCEPCARSPHREEAFQQQPVPQAVLRDVPTTQTLLYWSEAAHPQVPGPDRLRLRGGSCQRGFFFTEVCDRSE